MLLLFLMVYLPLYYLISETEAMTDNELVLRFLWILSAALTSVTWYDLKENILRHNILTIYSISKK